MDFFPWFWRFFRDCASLNFRIDCSNPGKSRFPGCSVCRTGETGKKLLQGKGSSVVEKAGNVVQHSQGIPAFPRTTFPPSIPSWHLWTQRIWSTSLQTLLPSRYPRKILLLPKIPEVQSSSIPKFPDSPSIPGRHPAVFQTSQSWISRILQHPEQQEEGAIQGRNGMGITTAPRDGRI